MLGKTLFSFIKHGLNQTAELAEQLLHLVGRFIPIGLGCVIIIGLRAAALPQLLNFCPEACDFLLKLGCFIFVPTPCLSA